MSGAGLELILFEHQLLGEFQRSVSSGNNSYQRKAARWVPVKCIPRTRQVGQIPWSKVEYRVAQSALPTFDDW